MIALSCGIKYPQCIVRPPDIVGLCRRGFFFLSFFFLSSFFRRLISELAERNSTRIGHMVGSDSDLKTHVQNLGYPLPYKSGTPKQPFWTTSQLNGKFNALYLRNDTRYRQSVKCDDNYKGSPTSSQNIKNFGPQTASNSTCIFIHPLKILHSASLPGFAQSSQTEISKRNSTKRCQVMGSKSP